MRIGKHTFKIERRDKKIRILRELTMFVYVFV